MKIEEEGIIVKVAGEVTAIKQRLLDMGFVRGAKVSVLRVAPLGDPIEVRIKGSCVALRKNEAYSILVELTSVQELVQLGCHH